MRALSITSLLLVLGACGPADGPILFEFALAPPEELGWAAPLPGTPLSPADFTGASARCLGKIEEESLFVETQGLPPLPSADLGYWLVLLLESHPIAPQGHEGTGHEHSSEPERKELGSLAPDALGRTLRLFLEPKLANTAGAVIELRAPGASPVDVLTGSIGNLDTLAPFVPSAPEPSGHHH